MIKQFWWLVLLFLAWPVKAAEISDWIDRHDQQATALADKIWGLAELGYLESKSSRALQQELQKSGFQIVTGVADIPTAFVATFGEGRPVIGILAEFDALPGMSQAALAVRQPTIDEAPGHACGHHLFGTASVTAGRAIANWLKTSSTTGTVKVFGTPAEEGGSGKVYMTRAGLFADVDVVLHWHPSDRNDASPSSSTANKSGRFRFTGIAAHAASAPERGRSALDGVEAMNHMVNMMREHVPQESRLHYVITKGGMAPNIVPELAEVYYYVRHPQRDMVVELFERVVKAATGAALGTGTQMHYEVMHGNYPVLPNNVLANLVYKNLQRLGGLTYTADETQFARELRQTLLAPNLELGSENTIQPFKFRQGMGSTDVGDVSWQVPTVGFRTATWVPGVPAHSWQAVAAGGTSIGHKGMLLAAKVLASSARDLYLDRDLVRRAKAELAESQGADFKYAALLGDREPPLDYRK